MWDCSFRQEGDAQDRNGCQIEEGQDDSRVTKKRTRRRTRRPPGGIEEIEKPTMVEQHNTHMGRVDKGDQLMSYYSFSHRTLKWWRRAFFHLIGNAIINAYILYVRSDQSARKLDHKHFRIELAKQLLGSDAPIQPLSRLNALPPLARLTERHFLEKVGPCTSGRPSQPVCVVYSNKRGRGKKTTTYQCKQCKLPMCVPCFELYHTKIDPVRHLEHV